MWQTVMVKILGLILSQVTPEFRQLLCDGIDKLDKMAAKTKNKFDDLAVDILKALVACD